MKKFVAGLIVGILLVPVAFYLYMLSGQAPVATSEPPMPFETFFAKTALSARLEKAMPRTVPIPGDEANFMAGAKIYKRHCGGCHGMIGRPSSSLAHGMFPHPPQLLQPNHMVTDDPPGETFWKVKNGIRLSGMPGFHASLSDEQIWQVSLMLANADKLSGSLQQELTYTPPPEPTSSPAKPARK